MFDIPFYNFFISSYFFSKELYGVFDEYGVDFSGTTLYALGFFDVLLIVGAIFLVSGILYGSLFFLSRFIFQKYHLISSLSRLVGYNVFLLHILLRLVPFGYILSILINLSTDMSLKREILYGVVTNILWIGYFTWYFLLIRG